MKKATLIISIIFLINVNSTAQTTFNVIKVNGQIIIIKSGIELKTGLKFSDREKLKFETQDSKATVINSEIGRMILSPSNTSKVGANYLPAMSNISSRGGILLNLIDLKNYFDNDLFIIEKEEIIINAPDFPMNDDNFFFIRYTYGGEIINKKLLFESSKLIIDRQELFTIDEKPLPNPEVSEMQLWYFKNNSSSVRICDLNLVFPDKEVLKNEIKVIIDTYKAKPKNDTIDAIISYISEFYGKPNEINLKSWLGDNFDL